GNKSTVVTNTTVEIKVPENVIDFVYGENGRNLARLRELKEWLKVATRRGKISSRVCSSDNTLPMSLL
ncbi:hypothetical protein ES319_A06G088300v1, partial [Gossypium barbadense]